MINPDELERAVERLSLIPPYLEDKVTWSQSGAHPYPGRVTDSNALYAADLRLILSANRKMREALERIEPMIPLLQMITVRQVIEAGPSAISAAGLDPWCVNEGRATGDEPAIAAWKFDDLRSALSTKETT